MRRWGQVLRRLLDSFFPEPPKRTGFLAESPNWEQCPSMDNLGICEQSVPLSEHKGDDLGRWYHPKQQMEVR